MPSLAVRSEGDPELFINRELSLLAFDRRVLEQARDPSTPLLERVRFLTICSTNLDEFFEIRVSRLKQQVAFGVAHVGPDGLSPQETLGHISRLAHELVEQQYLQEHEHQKAEQVGYDRSDHGRSFIAASVSRSVRCRSSTT